MKDWPPRVLSNLYRNGLQTFYDLLVDLITKSLDWSEKSTGAGGDCSLRDAELRKEAEKRLIEEGDPPEYLTLLKKSYAVISETAPRLGYVSFEQRWTQEQIVERIIVLQFQQEDKPSHVLCAGYRKLRPSVGESSQRRSPPGLEFVCENSSMDIVNSPIWKTLLSRVGDLIMLHVLTHASVFSPLPNNCFLQVSGGPGNCVGTMRGKSLSVHLGEKMLGGIVRKQLISESQTARLKQLGKNLNRSGIEDEAKQPANRPETPADDTTSVADESKQAYAGNWEFAGKKVTEAVMYQTSNITISPHPKRRRSESTSTGLKTDITAGCSKCFDPCKGKIGSKRQRRVSRDQVRRNGELLKHDTVDTSKDTAFHVVRNSSHDMPAKCSEESIPSPRSRKAPERTTVQYSAYNKELLDDHGNSHSNNFRKRRKLTGKNEKDSQEGNKLSRIPEQSSSGYDALVPQLLKRGQISKKNTECSVQLQRGALKQETIPTHLSNHDREDSPMVQETCASPTQLGIASSSGKRVRLPSWKRRKLRQGQEFCRDLARKDLPLVSRREGQSVIAKDVNIAELQKPIRKVKVITETDREDSHLSASGFRQLQPSDKTDFGGAFPSGESTSEKSFGNVLPESTPHRKKSPFVGTADGIREKLVDRAPIFYISSFSCQPGLPAKHILNTAQPNEAGVAHLFSAIFGARCDISGGSSSGRHMYANSSRRGRHFKSVHKLLQDLLSNARRCAFARLLGRHCPLPEGFHSIHKDSPPVSAPLPESQTPNTERKGSELHNDMHEYEQQEFSSPDPAPEVVKFMSLWLGPNYQPRERTKVRHSGTYSTSPSKLVPERREVSPIAQKTTTSSVETTEQLKEDGALGSSMDNNSVIEKNKQAELLSCRTSHSKVVAFLWAVCRSIIPQEMLGCMRSWRALRSSVAHFVGLRRHEKFNVKHALFKLRLRSFSWLAFQCDKNSTNQQTPSRRVTVEERATQQTGLELWLYWLFTSLVVPLIRAHFYVTEIENYRQNVFYYRKPVWARIRSNGVREMTSKNYTKLSKQAVAQVLNSRVLGFSQIRFLPKETGLRPIANLAASSQGTLKFSIRTIGQATLSQVFGNSSKELALGDCYKIDDRVPSWPRSVPPIVNGMSQCAALIPHEASPSIDADKIAVGERFYTVDLSSSKTSAALKGSSWSLSAGTRRSSTIFLKSPNIPKRSKKSVKFSFRSINYELRDTYCCLKLEKDAHPEDLGSSVFGYSDVHSKILPFIMQLKESPTGMPRLFMAVCDWSKAYDNIPQEKLQKIVENFVQRSNYKVGRYTCVTSTLASVRVSHHRTCTLADEPKKFVDSVPDLANKRSHCIFVDQAVSTNVRRDRVLAMLEEHVKHNIVQIGSQFYQQKVGIPQGSVLSSLLCSLFYGHFEMHSLLPVVQSRSTETSNQVMDTISAFCEGNGESAEGDPCLTSCIAKTARFHEWDDIEQLLQLSLEIPEKGQDYFVGSKPQIRNEANPGSDISGFQDNCVPSSRKQSCEEAGIFERDSVLLRLIDDSLFISTSEGGAKLFVESIHKGSKEYGCQANERKTATSFFLQLGKDVLHRKVYKSEDGACFMRWSGLLVNCFTLEFQADYTRYCGEHIRSSLTVRREQNQGWQLVLKMCQYMRPKCHALFFDPRINSPATIRLNAFQSFLLCAMKFHAYICCLPRVTIMNEPFLYKAIDCATRYMYGLLRHKMHSVGAEAEAYFPYKELEWLGLVAFYRVLKRKQARYQILLHILQTHLQMPKYSKLRACPHLSSATDERRSSMFKFIKY